MPDSFIDIINKTYELLKSVPPFPVAVWCVDRPDFHQRILDYCVEHSISTDRVHFDASGRFFYWPSTLGLRLENWTSYEVAERAGILIQQGRTQQYINDLFPFRESGVWVQMSRPPHTQIATFQQVQEIIK